MPVVVTTIVDYLIHPRMFGSVFTQAIVTGIGRVHFAYFKIEHTGVA